MLFRSNPVFWDSFGVAANITNNTHHCGPPISGSFGVTFYGDVNQRWIKTVPLDLSKGGDISFKMGQTNCNKAESQEGLYVYYSTNNGSNWYQIGYESPPSTSYPYWKTCTLTLPPAAHTTSTMLLFTQTYAS